MIEHASNLRIVFDPTGANYLLLDWGQRTRDIVLPWNQQIDSEGLIGATHDFFTPRGNTSREWTFYSLVEHADWEAKSAAVFSRDAGIPRTKATLEVRVLDLSADPSGDVASRTDALYTATASIRSMTPAAAVNPLHEWLEWTLKVGAFS